MKIKELIELLKQQKPDAEVLFQEFDKEYNCHFFALEQAINQKHQDGRNEVWFIKGIWLKTELLADEK